MVWDSNLGGRLYIYHGPSSWEGAFVRTNTGDEKAPVSGSIVVPEVECDPMDAHSELEISGYWDEVFTKNAGTCQFTIRRAEDGTYGIEGSFTFKGEAVPHGR